ncbi:alpha/beta fold hydrolase [Spirosoma flavum]|uniref:Alpha/beta fold hydrolase n=1 Tax=Spirosoma flavum TaxID=2048557 RepID=A0ABW6ATB4_9BACT
MVHSLFFKLSLGMHLKKHSYFKDRQKAVTWFEQWVSQLEQLNHKRYDRIELQTSLGTTHIWAINTQDTQAETIIIFPGARTSSLFWDFNNNLHLFGKNYRLFLIETNGLPNLSDGDTPDIRSADYGQWALEILDQLQVEKVYLAGASFGGLICLKLCQIAPERIKATFLLNPGCLQPFSLAAKNLYYNLLPILWPSKRNVLKFLDKAVLCPPTHDLSPAYKELLVTYELYAITQYTDNTQKPYSMKGELGAIKTAIFLLVGDNDLLFPYNQSIANAQGELASLREVIVFTQVGHGIETYREALQVIKDRIEQFVGA